MKNPPMLAGVIRHILTAAGGATWFGSEDEMTQVIGAIATLIGFGWSLWSKHRAASSPPEIPVAILAGLLAVPAFTGCSTAQIGAAITPARVESIAALGSYFGAKAAIVQGHRGELEAALKGLQTMVASDSADLVAVAAALESAGVPGIGSTEGVLVIGVLSTISDLWAHSGQVVLDDERARAALTGIVRGLELALASPRGLHTGDPIGSALLEETIATRPAR